VSRPRLVLVRHGQTEWSKSGRHTGNTNIPLTELGREQASAIAPRLVGNPFSAVLVSPLGRARETCELAGFGPVAEVEEGLREWDYGEFEGVTTAVIRETWPDWLIWRDGCPGGEKAADVGARADAVLDRLRALSGSVLVFSHGHFLRVLAARWCGASPSWGSALRLDTATISLLGWEREVPVVVRWNDDRHLDPSGL
jgi:probable phosphoglycerate mutase